MTACISSEAQNLCIYKGIYKVDVQWSYIETGGKDDEYIEN